MSDIIDAAAEIVIAADREEALARIGALLSKYPNGLMMFIISDVVDDKITTEIATNARRDALMYMMGVVATNLVRGALDELQ